MAALKPNPLGEIHESLQGLWVALGKKNVLSAPLYRFMSLLNNVSQAVTTHPAIYLSHPIIFLAKLSNS